jgi:hypothetical protein
MSAGCGLNRGNIMQDHRWYLKMQDLLIPRQELYRRITCGGMSAGERIYIRHFPSDRGSIEEHRGNTSRLNAMAPGKTSTAVQVIWRKAGYTKRKVCGMPATFPVRNPSRFNLLAMAYSLSDPLLLVIIETIIKNISKSSLAV